MKYRPEIDGLRAIAVVPVILFHGGVPGFSGGYVGVDVFFVISGYLIGSIIHSEITAGNFSLINFYERRARRILPALFAVAMASTVVGWFVLLPIEFRDFGQSLAALALFGSNFLFWIESGYFDGTAEFKPLLHTWSLAVEEQFYLLLPFSLLILRRVRLLILISVILVVGLLSLIHAQLLLDTRPSSSFYLLPSRGWELLVGTLIAIWPTSDRAKLPNALSEWASLSGLVLVVAPIFLYSPQTPFPGVSALPPVLGTALVIAFCTPQTLMGKILSFQPIVWIGLISYSLYLWHQPIVAFSKYLDLPDYKLFIGLALTFPLAALSWVFVEQPFRKKFSQRFIFLISSGMMLFFIGIGGAIHLAKGFENRYDAATLEILNNTERQSRGQDPGQFGCWMATDLGSGEMEDCLQEATNVLIWGDTHAWEIARGLASYNDEMGETFTWQAAGQSACPPLLDYDFSDRPFCKEINGAVLDFIKLNPPDSLILHANWHYRSHFGLGAEGLSIQELSTLLDLSIQKIQEEAPETSILLVSNVPMWYPSLPSEYVRQTTLGVTSQYLKNRQYSDVATLNSELNEVARRTSIDYADPLRFFCEEDYCKAIENVDGKNYLLAYDAAHLTIVGSYLLYEGLLRNRIQKSVPFIESNDSR